MKISLVVPAYNEEKLIARSLASIRAALVPFRQRGWETELIVCDNNSNDRTAALAREAGALVVFEAVNQISRARNRGAQAATGNWLIFVDADSYASEELEFSRRLRQHARGLGKTTVILARHPLMTSARRVKLCSRFEFVRLLWATAWQRGANLRRRDACAIWYDGRR